MKLKGRLAWWLGFLPPHAEGIGWRPPSLGPQPHVQYCIWLGVQSCSHGPGRSLLDRKDVSHHAKKKTPKLPIPWRSCGEEMAHASLTIKHGGREQTGQSNIFSMHTREGSSRQQSPMVRASLSPLFGGLVCQASPSPSVFLCTLSFSITVLASLQGVHPHPNPLSPPDTLADETSGSLSLYRNFLFPLFQNISMAMLLPSELPVSEQHTFFLVTVILPTPSDPWMLIFCRKPWNRLSCTAVTRFSSKFYCFLLGIALALNDLFLLLPTPLVLLTHKLKDTYNLYHASILQSL